MGLASALSTAVTGLKITQQAVDLTAKNVANADSPGYTSKTLLQEAVIADGETIGVRSSGVARATSRLVQSEYRNELEGYGYADTLGEFYQRIDQLFGTPGSTDALDSLYNNLTESLTQLSGTPESEAMQTQVVADATVLAHRLNGISDDIQTMRQEAETRLSETVDRVNALLGQLETTSSRIVSRTVAGSQPVDLLDQRDQIIDELSRYMDLTLIEREDGGINVLTSTGTLLFDTNAAKLQFNAKTVNGAQTLYNRDDSISDLGTISIVSGAGYSIDLIADNAIRGGELGALIEMRDDILVEAQQQLDEFAAALSRSFSDNPVDGTAVTVGAQDGFDIDLAALQSGDPITLTYTESGNSHVVTFIPTQDGSILPLSDDATARADDTVVGIDFSLGNAAVATQIQAALGANFTVSDQGGSVIRILDDGAAGLVDIDSLDAVATATALTDQGLGFPLFIDGSHSPDAYSGSFDGSSQLVGFSGRIMVNEAVTADPQALITYATSPATASGDASRPKEILDRLEAADTRFSAATGLGGPSGYQASVSKFLLQVIAYQGGAAANAADSLEAQDQIVNQLHEEYISDTGVNVDEQLSRLIELQNAYAANARVVSVIDDMIDTLMNI